MYMASRASLRRNLQYTPTPWPAYRITDSIVKFFGKAVRVGGSVTRLEVPVSCLTSPPTRNSAVPPRTFQCGGASSPVMSVKSSKNTALSPGTKSAFTALRSGWPPEAGVAGRVGAAAAVGAIGATAVAGGAGAGLTAVRLPSAGPDRELARRTKRAPGSKRKFGASVDIRAATVAVR